MKTQIFNTLFILAIITGFTSCKKDDVMPSGTETGILTLDFDPRFGDQAFDFDVNFTLSNGEIVKFSTFKYFISNIELIKNGQVAYTVPKKESFFLIDNSKTASRTIQLSDIPVDNYTEIRFIVGIDSLTNTLPVEERTGTLDVGTTAAGMYWAWNSGYIFLKVEGTSETNPAEDKSFQYHIGGFGGYSTPTVNNIRTVSVYRTDYAPISIQANKTRDAHILVDLKKLFETPTPFSVAENSMVMLSPFSTTISGNYMNMFTLDHVH